MLLYNQQRDYTYEAAEKPGTFTTSTDRGKAGLAGRTTYSLHNRHFVESF